MHTTLFNALGVRRGARLFGCFKHRLDLGGLDVLAHGELTFLFGTSDDQDRPVVYLDTANVVLGETDSENGPPSVCLKPGERPRLEWDERERSAAGAFAAMIDFPDTRLTDPKQEPSPEETDTPGPAGAETEVSITGQFSSEVSPREFGVEQVKGELVIVLPPPVAERYRIPELRIIFEIPMIWLRFSPKRTLELQPVFIARAGRRPPTGEDFYPGLARANEIWSKCCIEFTARCPIYVDEQAWREATVAEAVAFKDSVNVDDAIEVFMVESLVPPATWGGGATFASGTATAKVVSGDNQLPLNRNHLAHELGHVLGLGHPAAPNGLHPGCAGSVLEPSGFFADNPEFQCESNCINASNPLLKTAFWQGCFSVDRPDQQLF